MPFRQRKVAYRHHRQRLGLKENDQGILMCRGRVQVHYSVYLDDKHPYTVKPVEDAHRRP